MAMAAEAMAAEATAEAAMAVAAEAMAATATAEAVMAMAAEATRGSIRNCKPPESQPIAYSSTSRFTTQGHTIFEADEIAQLRQP